MDNIHPHDLTDYLNSKNIAVRSGHHCNQILHTEIIKKPGTVRASTHIYNDENDIKKLKLALISAKKFFNNI
jgi:cysteine desulfurase/selenocysteine lyase